jgi:hypothetical protein
VSLPELKRRTGDAQVGLASSVHDAQTAGVCCSGAGVKEVRLPELAEEERPSLVGVCGFVGRMRMRMLCGDSLAGCGGYRGRGRLCKEVQRTVRRYKGGGARADAARGEGDGGAATLEPAMMAGYAMLHGRCDAVLPSRRRGSSSV